MFFLYGKRIKNKFLSKHNTQNDKPSPTCIKGLCQNRISYSIKSIKAHIGRMSRFSSFPMVKASMTIEAALVLPLFLFFFLQISGFIEMLRLHSNLQYGLWKAGKTLMLYGAAEEVAETVPELAVSYLYVNGVLQSTLGKEYLDNSPLALGSNGINFLEPDIITESGDVDVTITYQVRPKGQLLPFAYGRLSNRFYGKVWNGYDISSGSESGQVAYVTRYGEVWHITRECSYLDLSVQTALARELGNYRNQWGKSYVKCSFCATGAMPEQVYITQEGDCFHYKEGCLGLTRHVEIISWEEREKYRPCSRCVGG